MKKTIKYTIIIALCVLFSASAFSQSSQKENLQKTDSVALWNKRIDSVLSTTTIKLFQSWLYENATVKQYQEGKFVDLYNAFVQRQYEIWIASKSQPKK